MNIKTFLKRTLSGLQHLSAIILLSLSPLPFFKWYLSRPYIPGSDFYNTGSYLKKLIEDPQFPALKWLYHWFSGNPLSSDYPNLHLYAMLPLVKNLGIIQAQTLYALTSLIIFAVFSYLLFWQLSKNKIISVVLAVGVVYSASLYPSLITIGSVTFFSSQAFLPLSLYLLAKWRESKNTKFFYLSALSTGFSMYGHATLGLVFVLPISLLMVYFSSKKEGVKKASFYLILSILVGSATAFYYLGVTISRLIPTSDPRGLFTFIEWEGKANFWGDFFGINVLLILIALFITIASLVIRRQKGKAGAKPYAAAFLYLVAYNVLLHLRLNPFSAVLNWPRSLWAFPLILGAVSASLYHNLKPLHNRLYKRLILSGILLISLLLPQTTSLKPMEKRAGGGYTYPSFVNQNLSPQELDDLKDKLVPQWLDHSSKQERLYSLDDRLNMWWSAFFDLPQVRGYFPGLSSSKRESFLNQLDISIMENVMIKKLGTSRERAKNAARFYLEWYSIKYLALTDRPSLSPYFETDSFIKRRENVHSISYIELDDNLYSPILALTNSPALCVLGSDNAYNYFIRGLARFNLNSKVLIPVNGPAYVEDLKKSFLDTCDAFVLYDFRTRPFPPNLIARRTGWKGLEEAVLSGKSLFIETGESSSAGAKGLSLPEFFPISQTRLEPLGETWEFKIMTESLLKGVKVNFFSPPIWENYPWKLSFSAPDRVRGWAKIILANKGNPVLVTGTFGKGKVVWSGLNLPFHMDYYDNKEEARLFLNIINEIIKSLREKEVAEEIAFNINWISPEKRILTIDKAKGVLFKERWDSGWKATTPQGKKLDIYPVGPNYPGFMYVRLPNESTDGPLTFSYSGSPLVWFYYLLSFTSIGILLDEVIFNGKILSKRVQGKLKKKLKLTKRWWDKER
jgi:hypothetical protein